MKQDDIRQEDVRRDLLRSFAVVEGGQGLIDFGRAVNSKVANYPSPPLHFELAEAACTPKWEARASDGLGKDDNIVREAPRGFAKTTVLAVWWPLWHAFVRPYAHGLITWEEYVRSATQYKRARDLRPSAHFALISKTRSHSINNLTNIKEILDAPRFRWLFGRHGFEESKERGGMWTKDELRLAYTGDVFHARGTGQPIRGLNLGGNRLTGFIFDDPEDENNTKTEAALLSNLDYLQKGLEPAMATHDMGGDKGVVIGTPIVAGCMVRKLADFSVKGAGWDHKRYAAILTGDDEAEGARHEVSKVVTSEDRRSLWPEMWPLAKLDAKRAVFETQTRLSVFYSEYMCAIVYDEKRAFKKWGYWKGDLKVEHGRHYLHITHSSPPTEDTETRSDSLVELEEPRVVPVNVFTGVDPASSTKKRADRTAVMPWAVDADDNRYALPYLAERVTPLNAARNVKRSNAQNQPLRTGVEANGYQDMLREYLQNEGVQGVWKIKTPSTERKEERLEGMGGHWEDGRVFLQPDMGILEHEATTFPNGDHDDTLDGTYFAFKLMYRPQHTAEREAKKKKAREKPSNSWMAA